MKVTFDISPVELEEILREHFKGKESIKYVSEVKFVVEKQSVGYGTMERDVTIFTGAKVKVDI